MLYTLNKFNDLWWFISVKIVSVRPLSTVGWELSSLYCEHPPTKRETSESVSTLGTHSWTETCKLLRMQSIITCKVKGSTTVTDNVLQTATSNRDKGVLSRERERERRIWRNVSNPLRSKYHWERGGSGKERVWGTTQTTITVPIKGRSDVGGIVSATMLRKNVSESNTVTSKTNISS